MSFGLAPRRGTWRRAALLGAAALAALAGCSSDPGRVSLAAPGSKLTHQDYEQQLARWTRSTKIIKQLDTTLRVHAVLFAPEFTEAYVARHGHVFKLSRTKRTALAASLRQQWSESYLFIVAAATMDYTWNDLERKESVWNLTLANDAREQVSSSEIKAERQISATTIDFFPFVERFHRVYWVRFPRALPDGRPLVRTGTERLSLRLSGSLGHAVLDWQIR